MHNEVIFHIVKLVVAAIMLLCAILVWHRTRDTARVLLVFTAIVWYIQILVNFLGAVALIPILPPIIRLAIDSAPLIMFSIALMSFLSDRDFI